MRVEKMRKIYERHRIQQQVSESSMYTYNVRTIAKYFLYTKNSLVTLLYHLVLFVFTSRSFPIVNLFSYN